MTAGLQTRLLAPALLALGAFGGALTTGVLFVGQLKSPSQAAADAAPPAASLVTYEVTRRILADESIFRGRIVHQSAAGLMPASGESELQVVTALHKRAGDRVRHGDPIVEISGRPVIALKGSFPAYRDLVGGLVGPDVRQLQQSLRLLGFAVVVDGVFGPKTQQALEGHYRRNGYEVLPGDVDAVNQLEAAELALNGSIRAADDASTEYARAIEAYEDAQASGGDSSDERAALAAARDQLAASQLEVRSATIEFRRLALLAGPSLPRNEVTYLGTFPIRIVRVNVDVGSDLSTLTTSMVEFDAREARLRILVPSDTALSLALGDPAKALDPQTGEQYSVEVTEISDAPIEDSDTGETGYEVFLAPLGNGGLPASPDRTLEIAIHGESTKTPVLAVPVTAIYSRPDGSSYVTVVRSGKLSDVIVATGLIVGGFVEVESETDSLHEGDVVVVGAEESFVAGAP